MNTFATQKTPRDRLAGAVLGALYAGCMTSFFATAPLNALCKRFSSPADDLDDARLRASTGVSARPAHLPGRDKKDQGSRHKKLIATPQRLAPGVGPQPQIVLDELFAINSFLDDFQAEEAARHLYDQKYERTEGVGTAGQERPQIARTLAGYKSSVLLLGEQEPGLKLSQRSVRRGLETSPFSRASRRMDATTSAPAGRALPDCGDILGNPGQTQISKPNLKSNINKQQKKPNSPR